MSDIHFLGKLLIDTDLRCVTALHIGGTQEGYEIGGMDNPVIKTPVKIMANDIELPAGCPYIPGSSLKGKMRSLLEWANGKIIPEMDRNGNFTGPLCKCGSEECSVCVAFGVSASDSSRSGPTRITVLDSFPDKKTFTAWEEDMGEGIFTEVKSENYIDRLTSAAMPRPMERVPAGSVFRTNIIYSFYRTSDLDMLKDVFTSMEILEDSTLGGSGSRGSGRVSFSNFDIRYRPRGYYTDGTEELQVGQDKSIASLRELRQGFEDIFSGVRAELEAAVRK